MSHPLFPTPPDVADDERDIGWIHVTRFEVGGQSYSPRLFKADELTDLSDLANMFGGGTYELIARDQNRARVTARQRYVIAGAPKSLTGEAPPAAAPAQHAPAPSSDGGAIGMAFNCMQNMMQSFATIVQSQAQQQTQFLTTMMQASKSDAQAMIQGMGELSKAQTAVMAEALKASAASAASGAGRGDGGADQVIDVLRVGMEMGESMAGARHSPELETIQAITAGVQAFKGDKPKGTNGAPASG